jgi:hypothetical protein
LADSLQISQSINTISTLIFDKVIDLANDQPAQANFDSDGAVIIIDDDEQQSNFFESF